MTSQVLIASYAKDFQWLIHCLGSLKRFSVGFLPPVICVDDADLAGCREIIAQSYPEAIAVVKNGQGFMRAQLAMMSGDLLCPEADFIFLVGSDCIAAAPFSPDPFFTREGKPMMYYTPYEALAGVGHGGATSWQKGVTRVLGFEPHAEFMRRLPLVYPRQLFPKMREHVAAHHGMAFEDYIYAGEKAHGFTSESNCLGAYAWKFMPDIYHWVNTVDIGIKSWNGEAEEWPNPIRQFWSWGGLDRITDANFVFNGKSSVGRTPREIINEVLYDIPCPGTMKINDIRSRLDLPRFLKENRMNGAGVEVGVLFGEYSEAFLDRWDGKLWMVDPWINQAPTAYLDGCNAVNMEEAHAATVARVARFGPRAQILREFSSVAAQRFADNSLDIVFLDGNHAGPEVAADIARWWPKVRPTGVLAGHDFYERHDAYQNCGVQKAVEEFAQREKLSVVLTEDTSWFILKP